MTSLENQLRCSLNGKYERDRYERLQNYLRQCIGPCCKRLVCHTSRFNGFARTACATCGRSWRMGRSSRSFNSHFVIRATR